MQLPDLTYMFIEHVWTLLNTGCNQARIEDFVSRGPDGVGVGGVSPPG